MLSSPSLLPFTHIHTIGLAKYITGAIGFPFVLLIICAKKWRIENRRKRRGNRQHVAVKSIHLCCHPTHQSQWSVVLSSSPETPHCASGHLLLAAIIAVRVATHSHPLFCSLPVAVFEGKATLRQLAKNWCVYLHCCTCRCACQRALSMLRINATSHRLGSYLGNLLGCALGVFLLLNSGLM